MGDNTKVERKHIGRIWGAWKVLGACRGVRFYLNYFEGREEGF